MIASFAEGSASCSNNVSRVFFDGAGDGCIGSSSKTKLSSCLVVGRARIVEVEDAGLRGADKLRWGVVVAAPWRRCWGVDRIGGTALLRGPARGTDEGTGTPLVRRCCFR